jgi:hypothetical protein
VLCCSWPIRVVSAHALIWVRLLACHATSPPPRCLLLPVVSPPQSPLSQTLHRVHASFECLLDILQLQQELTAAAAAAAGPAATADGAAAVVAPGASSSDAVLLGVARDLLSAGGQAGRGTLTVGQCEPGLQAGVRSTPPICTA